jgi:copper homeostasis protein
MNDSILIEVCVDSISSAVAAERGGANRVELCSSLVEAGITPSAALIELTRARISIGLQVMIRPRGGDFCYTAEEFEVMQRDVAIAKELGADGVVFGILTPAGKVDVDRTRELVEMAKPMQVTFHRAFDVTADLFRALEDVCATGADRILTSGGEATALEGSSVIAGLVKAARGRVTIMAGGGIRANNVARIIEQTGVREIHSGLRSPMSSPMLRQNSRVFLGTAPGLEDQRLEVLEEDVRNLRGAVARARV